jgi:hypothetical protein
VDVLHVTTTHPIDDTRVWYRMGHTGFELGYSIGLLGLPPRGPAPADIEAYVVLGVERRLVRPLVGLVRVVNAYRKFRPSVVHIHDPELILCIPLLRLLSRFQVGIVFDLHEDLSYDLPTRTWCPKTLRPFVKLLARFLMRSCARASDRTVVAYAGIAATIAYSGANCTVLKNLPRGAVDTSVRSPTVRRGQVCVTGGLDDARGLALIEGAASRRLPESVKHVHLAGRGDEARLKRLERVDSRIRWHGDLPMHDVRSLQARCSVGLALYADGHVDPEGISTKLLEYVHAGLVPIVSDFAHGRRTIDSLNAPDLLASTPHDLVRSLASAVDLAGDPHFRSRLAELAANELWETQIPQIELLYASLMRAGR